MNSSHTEDETTAIQVIENHANVTWLPNYWSSFVEQPVSQQSTWYGVWIRLLGLPPVLLLGFIGNTIAVAVMLRPNMIRHSFSSYLVLLRICDFIALLVRLLFWVNLLQEFRGYPILISFTDLPSCIAIEYITTVTTVICSWVVVCVTYERVVVVTLPFTSSKLCTPSSSRKVVAVLILASLALLCYIPVNTRYFPATGCVMRDVPDMTLHYAMATTFVTMLPLALIFVGNAVVVVHLKRQDRLLRDTGNRGNRTGRITTMLVTVSLTFFFLVLPNAVIALCLALRADWARLNMARDPAAILWDINFAINFYIYVLTGSNVRAEVRAMFSYPETRPVTVSSHCVTASAHAE